jgi:hypothetical protein
MCNVAHFMQILEILVTQVEVMHVCISTPRVEFWEWHSVGLTPRSSTGWPWPLLRNPAELVRPTSSLGWKAAIPTLAWPQGQKVPPLAWPHVWKWRKKNFFFLIFSTTLPCPKIVATSRKKNLQVIWKFISMYMQNQAALVWCDCHSWMFSPSVSGCPELEMVWVQAINWVFFCTAASCCAAIVKPPLACLLQPLASQRWRVKPTAGDYAPRYETPQNLGWGGTGQADESACVKHPSTRARGVAHTGDRVLCSIVVRHRTPINSVQAWRRYTPHCSIF